MEEDDHFKAQDSDKPMFDDSDPSIASPAYEPFKKAGLLTMKYKIHSTGAIDTVPGNASVFGNTLIKSLSCFPGLLVCAPCFYSKFVKMFEVPRGSIQPFADGRGGFGFFGPGLHRVVDVAVTLTGRGPTALNTSIIKNGNLTIVTVPQGNLGFALDQGEPVLLPPGLHYIRSDTLSYERASTGLTPS